MRTVIVLVLLCGCAGPEHSWKQTFWIRSSEMEVRFLAPGKNGEYVERTGQVQDPELIRQITGGSPWQETHPPAQKEQPSPAFITGSHAYGTPNQMSDVDLVVLVDEQTESKLRQLSAEYDDDSNGFPCRFGDLNLIPLSNPLAYQAWKAATEQMVASPDKFDRDEAKDIVDANYERLGIGYLRRDHSGN